MMNVHHLELFYYVARHGGISEAVRRMPYGIQQPAVSSQIIQLEKQLGGSLFQRRPFALTPMGSELYAFVEPFFGGLDAMTRRLQGGVEHHIRIGASELVLKDHLPPVASAVREKMPALRMTLREGYRSTVLGWLEKDEIDLGFTLLGGELPATIRTMPLVKVPLVLMVRSRSRIQSAEELWQMDRIDESLITPSTFEEISRTFQAGLAARGIDWFTSIEVSSLNLIHTYVTEGYGIGLFLGVPGMSSLPGTRILPLPGFDPVVFGALWRGTPTPTVRAFLLAMFARAREMAGNDVMRAEDDLLKLLDGDKTARTNPPG